jgi:acetyltransferase
MLESFFNPKSVAVVGVSADPKKLGSLIFNNLQNAKYKGKLYPINTRVGGQELYGHMSFKNVREINEPLDLAILVVAAKFCSSVVDDCIANGTKNISIIAAGFSEIGNNKLENEIAEKCLKNNINLLGPNCLGHISTFTDLNASFADGYPSKGNVAFISQSGAYCCAMLDWAEKKKIGFSHFISIGNKTILGEDKILSILKDDINTKFFTFYLENLKNGKEFLKILTEVTKTKPCIILEPGKSKKAQMASLSHTGSLAPNYKILEIALQNAGAIKAKDTRQLFGLIETLVYSHHHNFEGNIAILTNGGGVGVLSSDLCEDNGLILEKPNENTIGNLKKVLPNMSSLNNPIDVLGDAKSDRYENALRILCESGQYNNIIVLLTPQLGTDSKGTAESIVKLYSEFPNINIYTSFIGGNRVQVGIDILRLNNIINFDFPTDCIELLGLLNKHNKKPAKIVELKSGEISEEIKNQIIKLKGEGVPSLPQDIVNMIMDYYKIDHPKHGNFTDKNKALEFCKTLFPHPIVMKLSSPDAIHKTEMKGIYLDVKDENQFNYSWDNLAEAINKYQLSNASILIQEMIFKSNEAIIGVNTDNNFGKIMIFGMGGIYTEIMEDISVRILPTNNFEEMINETKIGKILKGVRGEEPKALKEVIDVLNKVQQIAIDFPEIVSLDINPILITKQRAVVADFKILLK